MSVSFNSNGIMNVLESESEDNVSFVDVDEVLSNLDQSLPNELIVPDPTDGGKRVPLDRLEHPEYYRIVDTPMDLGTMREELQGDNYETPEDFCDDLRRIFTNAKNYTTEKKSRMYTMALRLSALAEQNMNRILNTWNNLNKKGGKKKHRRKLLMSDDENASVSEYEPPGVKKFPKKKRQLPDDEDPSTSKTKSTKGKKRFRRRMSGSDEGTSQNDNGPANINSSRPRTSKRMVAKSWNNSDEDMTNSDSDGDYHPSRAVSASAVNGYTRKRKPLSRPTRNMKINNKQENGNDELSSEKSKPKISNSVYVKLYNNINVNEPSTSKAAGISLPVRRAKMIHVEEKSESSEEEDEVKLSSHKKINNTINGKISKSESEESSEDTKSEILENGVNNDEDDDGEEEKGEDEDNEDDREEDENSEENSESESSDNDSDEEFKPATSQKPVRKTVKCIYPKRRIAKETDSDNVKENCVNSGQKNKKVAVQVKVNQRTRREVQTRVSQGKYPLRQTTKKNLVEESSDESKEEGGHYYKTRKSNQRPINGTSLYVENSNESENSSNLEDQDEDVGDSVEDDDSDAYTPSTNITRRGQKRRRSSDSTGGWSSGRGIYQRLRNTGCSKKTANGSDNSAKGRNCRTRSRKRKNSDSDVTLESNNSDSDNKPAAISVSSRGRVRKLTPRARAFLRD